MAGNAAETLGAMKEVDVCGSSERRQNGLESQGSASQGDGVQGAVNGLGIDYEATHEDLFPRRHLGVWGKTLEEMLMLLGESDLSTFISRVVPGQIRVRDNLVLSRFPDGISESQALQELKAKASKNSVRRSLIGLGYYDTITPGVIQRNILENPGWYTQYTPYQAEIAQGRLEALFNFQTMIADLTGLPVANASLLDEGTAAGEAMALQFSANKKADAQRRTYLVASDCHPQTIDVVRTRAFGLGLRVVVDDVRNFDLNDSVFGMLLQYPNTYGAVEDYSALIEKAHKEHILVAMATDLMALMLLKSPGDLGADIALGSAQRFGVPLGFGGPHAAFFATRDEFKRMMPGRLVGLSKDSYGRPALRLSLQTREQHIRREKATSNICTAQVLLAVMASMYAVYHGSEGLKRIAGGIHRRAGALAQGLKGAGYSLSADNYFDTVTFNHEKKVIAELAKRLEANKINVRRVTDGTVSIALDERTTDEEVTLLVGLAAAAAGAKISVSAAEECAIPAALRRTDAVLTHEVFHRYQSETEFLRYVRRLESRDLSLTTSMIPLGSCTMKLNATSEMFPVSWPEFASLHPFAPRDQTEGYLEMFDDLERALCEVTGFAAVSLQPNAGSQGEYAGLLAIRRYHLAQGAGDRRTCLIPESAHGTNPASAILAGLEVVPIRCAADGSIDLQDLEAKAEEHGKTLSCLMVTYPSTHGVFETEIADVCEIVHKHGGLVYVDGANMNALVGLCRVAEFGADVCHFNLHKTFCIPHGGGGPGMGPIGVNARLKPFLPGHIISGAVGEQRGHEPSFAVSAAHWGSAGILPIPWMYIAMMGGAGLTRASAIAILNANYIAARLRSHFSVLFTGPNGYVAHECILDLRVFKRTTGLEVEDVAKRLMDFGFHAPTVSWPVAGTLMVEPTESESKAELDRFCDAMIIIRQEIRDVEEGRITLADSPLRRAPHTAQDIADDNWSRAYTRWQAAYPAEWTKEHKFWPVVGRIDNAYGDRNLVCTCSG